MYNRFQKQGFHPRVLAQIAVLSKLQVPVDGNLVFKNVCTQENIIYWLFVLLNLYLCLFIFSAFPLFCENIKIHASSGDSSEAQHSRSKTLYSRAQRKNLPLLGSK